MKSEWNKNLIVDLLDSTRSLWSNRPNRAKLTIPVPAALSVETEETIGLWVSVGEKIDPNEDGTRFIVYFQAGLEQDGLMSLENFETKRFQDPHYYFVTDSELRRAIESSEGKNLIFRMQQGKLVVGSSIIEPSYIDYCSGFLKRLSNQSDLWADQESVRETCYAAGSNVFDAIRSQIDHRYLHEINSSLKLFQKNPLALTNQCLADEHKPCLVFSGTEDDIEEMNEMSNAAFFWTAFLTRLSGIATPYYDNQRKAIEFELIEPSFELIEPSIELTVPTPGGQLAQLAELVDKFAQRPNPLALRLIPLAAHLSILHQAQQGDSMLTWLDGYWFVLDYRHHTISLISASQSEANIGLVTIEMEDCFDEDEDQRFERDTEYYFLDSLLMLHLNQLNADKLTLQVYPSHLVLQESVCLKPVSTNKVRRWASQMSSQILTGKDAPPLLKDPAGQQAAIAVWKVARQLGIYDANSILQLATQPFQFIHELLLAACVTNEDLEDGSVENLRKKFANWVDTSYSEDVMKLLGAISLSVWERRYDAVYDQQDQHFRFINAGGNPFPFLERRETEDVKKWVSRCAEACPFTSDLRLQLLDTWLLSNDDAAYFAEQAVLLLQELNVPAPSLYGGIDWKEVGEHIYEAFQVEFGAGYIKRSQPDLLDQLEQLICDRIGYSRPEHGWQMLADRAMIWKTIADAAYKLHSDLKSQAIQLGRNRIDSDNRLESPLGAIRRTTSEKLVLRDDATLAEMVASGEYPIQALINLAAPRGKIRNKSVFLAPLSHKKALALTTVCREESFDTHPSPTMKEAALELLQNMASNARSLLEASTY